MEPQPDAGGRIEGNAPAAGVQHKIQRIRKIPQPGPDDRNAPGIKEDRKSGDEFGRFLNNGLLGIQRPGTHDEEEDRTQEKATCDTAYTVWQVKWFVLVNH